MRHGQEEGALGRLQRDLHRVVVDDLVAGDLLGLAVHELGRPDDALVEEGRRRERLDHHALEAVLEVRGGDLPVHRRRELDALLQVEGVGLAVRGDAPVLCRRDLRGEVGYELRAGLTRLVRVGEEGLVRQPLDAPRRDLPGDRRVELRRLALVGHRERAALDGLSRGRRAAAGPARIAGAAAGGEPHGEGEQRDQRHGHPCLRASPHVPCSFPDPPSGSDGVAGGPPAARRPFAYFFQYCVGSIWYTGCR